MTELIAIPLLVLIVLIALYINHSLDTQVLLLERQSESLTALARRLQSENNRLLDHETDRVNAKNNPQQKGTPQ